MGKIFLEGLEFFANHGFYEEERKIGNRYSVDVILEVDLETAAKKDELQGTIDYEEIYAVVKEVMQVETKLLEHLAGKIIDQIRKKFNRVEKVTVQVSKYNPPFKGLCRRATVELSS